MAGKIFINYRRNDTIATSGPNHHKKDIAGGHLRAEVPDNIDEANCAPLLAETNDWTKFSELRAGQA